jgi:hypothetical protein
MGNHGSLSLLFFMKTLKQTAGVISLNMTQLEPPQTNGKQLRVSPLYLI